MAGKTAKVFRNEPRPVANFDSVGPALRDFAEKRVEVPDKVTPVLVAGRPEARELEDDDSDVWQDGFARLVERAIEQVGIQEVFIRFARTDAEAVMRRQSWIVSSRTSGPTFS